MNTPRHIIALGAHPDDIEISMAGLMLRLADRGCRMTWVVATDGAGVTKDPTLSATRSNEANESAALAGATFISLGFPDGDLACQTELKPSLAQLFSQDPPTAVVTHDLDDYHPDHRALAEAVGAVVPYGVPVIRAEPMLGVGGRSPAVLVDIGAVFERKLECLSQHRSQNPQSMGEAVRTWNRFRGFQTGRRGFQYAEGYRFDSRFGADAWAIFEHAGGALAMG